MRDPFWETLQDRCTAYPTIMSHSDCDRLKNSFYAESYRQFYSDADALLTEYKGVHDPVKLTSLITRIQSIWTATNAGLAGPSEDYDILWQLVCTVKGMPELA